VATTVFGLLKGIFRRKWTMDAKRAAEWVMKQELEPGKAHEVTLPAEMAELAHRGTAHAAFLPDGRKFVLLKKSVGWKDNFEGVLYCDRPLSPGDVMSHGEGQPSFVCLADYGVFEELYIRASRDERQALEVYFDLN
jgi:hypothetical protein